MVCHCLILVCGDICVPGFILEQASFNGAYAGARGANLLLDRIRAMSQKNEMHIKLEARYTSFKLIFKETCFKLIFNIRN